MSHLNKTNMSLINNGMSGDFFKLTDGSIEYYP